MDKILGSSDSAAPGPFFSRRELDRATNSSYKNMTRCARNVFDIQIDNAVSGVAIANYGNDKCTGRSCCPGASWSLC